MKKADAEALKQGSSPLTRGKPVGGTCARAVPGLIPAHAGKTAAFAAAIKQMRAHPRSRGENTQRRRWNAVHVGSSPLTRGKHIAIVELAPDRGLIPAHAGKTRRPRRRGKFRWAHPRSRGENSPLHLTPSEIQGSSPLTRGKRRLRRGRAQRHGLIPAHAGKTHPTRHQRRTAWAHPRSRGENDLFLVSKEDTPGSSPLTRGKRTRRPALMRQDGLIPAHAGKTSTYASHSSGHRAHPRSRGENADALAHAGGGEGSSPLTRGKHALPE